MRRAVGRRGHGVCESQNKNCYVPGDSGCVCASTAPAGSRSAQGSPPS